MQLRSLGNTGMDLSILSFGASSLGQEFRAVDLDEALRSVRVALDSGINFIDTSPYYGRGMSEVLLGTALKDGPRDQYYLGTKLGRYDAAHLTSPQNASWKVSISACIAWESTISTSACAMTSNSWIGSKSSMKRSRNYEKSSKRARCGLSVSPAIP